MEQEFTPEVQVEQEIEKSKRTIDLASILLFILFSASIVGTILYFGKNESEVIKNKLEVMDTKVDSISNVQSKMENSLYDINQRLDDAIKQNQDVISNLDTLRTKMVRVNGKIDKIVNHIK